MAKRVISYTIYGIMVMHILLIFDGIPIWPTVIVGLAANGIYLRLLRTYPYFTVYSFEFIGSCVMVFVHHFASFSVFTAQYFPFLHIVAYFTLCVWLIPFVFFISLSANENTLPTVGSAPSQSSDLAGGPSDGSLGHVPRGKRNGLKALLGWVQLKADEYFPSRKKRLI
ncbi:hypothetical protein, variant [Capsaspora owczarzaki ATCC 30864]|nr:hypothetical protein, variant [Capsaspora owczarzaki ATCC 30864]